MEQHSDNEIQVHLRSLLAAGCALVIIYASLSPFTGWRDQGLSFLDVLALPFRLTYTTFDATLNLLAYVPFGFLVSMSMRGKFGGWGCFWIGGLAGILLSMGMEYLQMCLPTRTSSNVDLLANGMGSLLGALAASTLSARTNEFARLSRWRNVLFHRDKQTDYGLALFGLWLLGQINPSLPMLGNVFISEAARQPFVAVTPEHFSGLEAGVVMLNLVMPGMLLLTLLRTSRGLAIVLLSVLGIVALAKFFTAAVLLHSWALLLWINSEAVFGMLIGGMVLLFARHWSRNAIIVLGTLSSVSYLVMTNWLFDENSPQSARPIFHWHYGHLLTYNGLAQTIALVFPVLLLFHFWRVRK